MNLAEQIIVNGLKGKESPKFVGGKYIFVASGPDDINIIGEASSVYQALRNGIERGVSDDGETVPFEIMFTASDGADPAQWHGIEALPNEIRATNDANLIGFFLDMHQGFDFYTRDDEDVPEWNGYFAEILEIYVPAKFVFGWSASPPRQDEAFAVLEMLEDISNEQRVTN